MEKYPGLIYGIGLRRREHTMKKLISSVLALALVFTMLIMPASAASKFDTFTDIGGSPYKDAIRYCVEHNYMGGTGGTKFSPRLTVNRATMIQIIWSIMGRPEPSEDVVQFEDSVNHWAKKPIKWARESKIVAGTSKTTFSPNSPVIRAQAAVMLRALAKQDDSNSHKDITLDYAWVNQFDDAGNIPGYAKDAICWAVQYGLLWESEPFMIGSRDAVTREELARLIMNYFEPMDTETISPTRPKPTFVEPVKFSKTVAGLGVSGVEFKPDKGFTPKVVLANDKFFSTESASSMVSRSKAYVAVNGAFFDNAGDNSANGSFVNNGKILRIFGSTLKNPPPTFVIDSQGRASIQFMHIKQTVTRTGSDGKAVKLENIGCNTNLGANDGTRMIYTKEYGSKVPFKIALGLEVDADGTVKRVYKNASGVVIPSSGYVIVSRNPRGWGDDFYTAAKVGDKVDVAVKYEGSTTQDVKTVLGCGPTVVKNGKAYGNATTYANEGFSELKVTQGSVARMAIGVKKDGTVVIASTSGTLAQLSQVMVGLGCENAMNLDGGASKALYVKNAWSVSAGRALSNMLVFTKKGA